MAAAQIDRCSRRESSQNSADVFTLSNDQLSVELLDPAQDGGLLGARYCSGGYIFQVTDYAVGALLSGPTYPKSFNVYDGQGIPDSFALAPLETGEHGRNLVLGVGICEQGTVVEPCSWSVNERATSVRFTTRHVVHHWTIEVRRTVRLLGRTVRSRTTLRNLGTVRFPIVWFPHPFFPHPAHGEDDLLKLSMPVRVPPNEGYELARSGYLRRRNWPWAGPHYQALDLVRSRELRVVQRHPLLGQVSATTDYAPTYFPIWGNENTVSWEPMIERTIAAGQKVGWGLDYDF